MSKGKITPKNELLLQDFQSYWDKGEFDEALFTNLLKLLRKGMVATRELERIKRGFRKVKRVFYTIGPFSQGFAYPVAAVDKLFNKKKR